MSNLNESERESSGRMVVLRYFVMAATTLTLGCELIFQLLNTGTITCAITDEGTFDSDNDADGDKKVDCAAEDSTATGGVSSQGFSALVIASGPESEATVAGSTKSCWTVTEDSFIGVSPAFNVQWNRYCPGWVGWGLIDLSLWLSKNGGPRVNVVAGGAEFDCDATEVDNQGAFESCEQSIPSRHFCGRYTFLPDRLQVSLGDSVEMNLEVSVNNALVSGSDNAEPFEIDASIVSLLSGAITQVKCPSPLDCTTHTDCSPPRLCLDELCRAPSFATGAKPSFSTSPAPLTSGQAFSLSASAKQSTGDLLPYRIVLTVAAAAVDLNGPLSPDLVIGSCNLGNASRLVRVSSTANQFYLDLEPNGVQDATDPVGVVEDDGDELIATITIPAIGRSTVPASATVTCSFNTALIAGADGKYPINVQATSIDPDTRGANDNAGLDPLTFSKVLNLRIGNFGSTTSSTSSTTTTTTLTTSTTVDTGSSSTSSTSSTTLTTTTTTVPVAACGDPVDSGGGGGQVTAGDALFVLRAAVGSATCPDCTCDVDGNNAVTASDALLTLKKAVGHAVELSCPPCE